MGERLRSVGKRERGRTQSEYADCSNKRQKEKETPARKQQLKERKRETEKADERNEGLND